jgi:hypothetical protein
MTSNAASSGTGGTGVERIAHYRDQATQFRQWAEGETTLEARQGLLDLAGQYERLAREIEARIAARDGRGKAAPHEQIRRSAD